MRWLSVLVVTACSTADGRGPSVATTVDPPAPRAAGGAVVVELFTSQGCSSCPPADALLSKLASDRPDVIALAFHVDYWNDLGWADPWSSSEWSARQQMYAAGLTGQRVYTPELVVNGATGVVGSQRVAVDRAIADSAPVPSIATQVSVEDGAIQVRATLPAATLGEVAIVEDGLITAVRAGENRGEHLRNDRVVRALVPIEAATAIALDPHWNRDHLAVVVLARTADRRVAAASSTALTP
jgi:hypothetical protein